MTDRLRMRRRAPAPVPAPGAGLAGPSSIFMKSLRDSRRAVLLAGLILGFCELAAGSATQAYYPTVASRQLQVAAYDGTPAVGALFGLPIGIDTLGGLVSWRDASLIVLTLGMWSIVALSGALAGEASAGRAEMLLAVPLSRRRVALEKLGAHVFAMGVVALILAAFGWTTGMICSTLPGDSIAFDAALADFMGLGLLGLFGGALAFALSQWFGRGAGAGLAIAVFLGSFFVSAYRDVVPALRAISWLSPFHWTARNQPIAGSWDLISLVPVGLLVVALLAAGVEAFARRDLGAVMRMPRLGLPGRAFLLRGPARRILLDTRVPTLAWGLGLGLAMALIGLGGESVSRSATIDPAADRFVRQLFGDTDWTSAKGLIQLAFVWFGYVIVAFAATTFVEALAGDERRRRLDVILSTPVSRGSWLVRGALGVLGSVALMTLTLATLTALGVGLGHEDPVAPFLGIWVGALYAAALIGIAVAVLGLGGVELAPAVPVALGVGFFVVDTLANLLRLPSAATVVCLTHYLGRPIVGSWDWPGMALLAAVAVGGIGVGALSIARRDISN
jgi:ABC-2 type transport system permease protein